MSVVRLRVELADKPGSLAAVAAVLGAYAGNIVAIDVLQSQSGTVVDEITVEVPDDINLTELRRLIGTGSDARVLSYQLASTVDPVVRVLRRLADMFDARDSDPDTPLRRAVADLCSTPAVWVMTPDEACVYEAGRVAMRQPGTAAVLHTSEKLPALGESIRGETALLAIASPEEHSRRVVLVGRSVEQGFTPTESGRVEALVALHTKLVALEPAGPRV